MESILDIIGLSSNQMVILFCLIMAVVRIYLEVIGYDLSAMPVSELVSRKVGTDQIKKFHRTGLYLSIGYVILFAPEILFT